MRIHRRLLVQRRASRTGLLMTGTHRSSHGVARFNRSVNQWLETSYYKNHVSIYVLVRYSTKNAARCDTHCELYDSVNPWEFERIMYCRNISERLSVSVVTTFAYCMGTADIGFVSAVSSVQDALGTAATDKWNTCLLVMWMALCSDVHRTALTGTSRTRWETRSYVRHI